MLLVTSLIFYLHHMWTRYRIILPDLLKAESRPPQWTSWTASQFKTASQDLLKKLCELKGLSNLKNIQCGFVTPVQLACGFVRVEAQLICSACPRRTMMLYRASQHRDLYLRYDRSLNQHVTAMQVCCFRWLCKRRPFFHQPVRCFA